MIDEELLNEIKQYCTVNAINDVNKLINQMLKRGFTIEKYGETPTAVHKRIEEPKIVPVEDKVDKSVEVEKIITPPKSQFDLYGE